MGSSTLHSTIHVSRELVGLTGEDHVRQMRSHLACYARVLLWSGGSPRPPMSGSSEQCFLPISSVRGNPLNRGSYFHQEQTAYPVCGVFPESQSCLRGVIHYRFLGTAGQLRELRDVAS